MNTKSFQDIGELVNIGTGTDLTILELAELVKSIVGFTGYITLDNTKPDGNTTEIVGYIEDGAVGREGKGGVERGNIHR